MIHSLPALLLIIAGILGALQVDNRIAWVLVAFAGLLMIVPL